MTLVALATGCDDRDGTTPIRAVGVVTSPRRPFVVQHLPKGWSVQEVRRPGFPPVSVQTLYLAPGSTPEHGPAIAVGSYGQDDGGGLCGHIGHTTIKLRGPSPAETLEYRTGALREIEGEIDTDQPGYVLTRDLSEQELKVAARAAQFGEDRASIPPSGMPSGFRRVAAAPVIPNSTIGDRISLTNYSGRRFVTIGIYDGDAAANVLTRFWNATVNDIPCSRDDIKTTRTMHGSHVYATGDTSPGFLARIVDSLVVTDHAGLDAFRAKGRQLPPSAILGSCIEDPSRAVIIDGTDDRVRWVVGMSTAQQPSVTCAAFVVDGHPEPGMSTSQAPVLTGPNSHDIQVLEHGSFGLSTGPVTLVAGIVPDETKRVTISDAAGQTASARVVTPKADPAHRYFAGLLTPASQSNAALHVTVIASDDAGHEIGRSNPA
jgi:hypothetical protein